MADGEVGYGDRVSAVDSKDASIGYVRLGVGLNDGHIGAAATDGDVAVEGDRVNIGAGRDFDFIADVGLGQCIAEASAGIGIGAVASVGSCGGHIPNGPRGQCVGHPQGDEESQAAR